MTKLYSQLASVYHEMYQHIFDYEKEFEFYHSILQKEKIKSILEIACGSGMLAKRFIKAGYHYTGVDLFEEMLQIARKETASDCFIQADMRNLNLKKKFEAALITGHSIAHITTNKDILSTFKGIHKLLSKNGWLVFGAFEASAIFQDLKDFEQQIKINDKTIKRISKLRPNLSTGWTYDWSAKYIIEQNNIAEEIDDFSTLRAFTKDEIILFLKLSGFQIDTIIDENKAFTAICRSF